MPKNFEHYKQVEVIKWAKSMSFMFPELETLYAIPNGGRRTPKQAAWLLAEGLNPGIPDLHLPCCSYKWIQGQYTYDYCGLYIEMKHGKNGLTDSQSKMIPKLEKLGHKVVVCYSAEQAKIEIMEYLKTRRMKNGK